MPDEPQDEELDWEQAEGGPPGGEQGGRAPFDTQREIAYLKELVQTQAPVEVKLRTGETVAGFVEYYDKSFIRLTRVNAPNLFIFKRDIQYLYETKPRPAAPPGDRRRR